MTNAQLNAKQDWIEARDEFRRMNEQVCTPGPELLALSQREIVAWSRYQGMTGGAQSSNPEYR